MNGFGDDEHLSRAFQDDLSQHRTSIPAKIVKVNHEKNIVDVDIMITEWLGDKDHKIDTLKELPIVQMGNDDFSITVPIKVGDEGLIIFMDRSIDDWENGYQQNRDNRVMDISDGIFVPMQLRSSKKVIENYNKDSLEMRSSDGKTKIEITKSGEIKSYAEDTMMEISKSEINFIVGGEKVLRLGSDATFYKDINAQKDITVLGAVMILKDLTVTGTTKLLETFINAIKQTGN